MVPTVLEKWLQALMAFGGAGGTLVAAAPVELEPQPRRQWYRMGDRRFRRRWRLDTGGVSHGRGNGGVYGGGGGPAPMAPGGKGTRGELSSLRVPK